MSKEFKIGIFSIIIVTLAILGYRFIRGESPLGGAKIVKVKYDDVYELATSAPVLKQGVQIGTVTGMDFDEVNKKVVVELSITRSEGIPKNALANLNSPSLVGGKVIQITYDKPCSGADCISSGDELRGYESNIIEDFIGEDNIDQLGVRLRESINSAMEDSSQVNDMVNNLDRLTSNLADLTETLNRDLGGITRNLKGTLNNMNDITGNLAANDQIISDALRNLNTLSEKLSAMNPEETLSLANGSLEKVQGSLESLDDLLESTESSFVKLDGILNKINTETGTLGMLVNDPDLYDNLNQTSLELSLLLQDFRLNPKRYVNVSVFGKKQKEYKVPEDDPAQGIENQ